MAGVSGDKKADLLMFAVVVGIGFYLVNRARGAAAKAVETGREAAQFTGDLAVYYATKEPQQTAPHQLRWWGELFNTTEGY